jgi:hypothetical protein
MRRLKMKFIGKNGAVNVICDLCKKYELFDGKDIYGVERDEWFKIGWCDCFSRLKYDVDNYDRVFNKLVEGNDGEFDEVIGKIDNVIKELENWKRCVVEMKGMSRRERINCEYGEGGGLMDNDGSFDSLSELVEVFEFGGVVGMVEGMISKKLKKVGDEDELD